jgi:hypothetical protein
MAKFTGAHITGLNLNEYQVVRATHYAKREGLSGRLDFVQGDFMVSHPPDLLLLRLALSMDVLRTRNEQRMLTFCV